MKAILVEKRNKIYNTGKDRDSRGWVRFMGGEGHTHTEYTI